MTHSTSYNTRRLFGHGPIVIIYAFLVYICERTRVVPVSLFNQIYSTHSDKDKEARAISMSMPSLADAYGLKYWRKYFP